ncbi:unnamed protein product [Brachionus calyciflorus]|uniref:RNA helicase n=1 Tax=Brachionus calyciflorus TaxID=104777 RepID=A0A813X8Y1_9BILA|nr:unnamed protein product [Brachionus calyciflorus]
MDENWDDDWDTPAQQSKPPPPAPAPKIFQPSTFGRGRLLNSLSQQDKHEEPRHEFKRYDDHDTKSDYDRRQRSPPRDSYASRDRSSITDYIKVDSRSIGSLIGKAGSNINNIRDKCNVKIVVPNRDELQNQSKAEIRVIGSSRVDIDKAIQMIEQSCNNLSSSSNYGSRFESQKRTNDYNYDDSQKSYKKNYGDSPRSNSVSEEDENNNQQKPSIDWNLIRSLPLQNMEKFKDHPPVVKDFYVEDSEITQMTRDEVKQFRKDNFDIQVDFFKKEDLSYGLSSSNSKQEEKARTPEEIEDEIFKVIPKPVKTLEQAFGRYPEILHECQKQNFVKPTPVQSQLWPILLKGLDCVGIAQTGTGKTLAFLLPALVHIDNQLTPREKRVGPNVLVLSPTRELAIQIEKEVKKINYKGIKSVCIYGGGDRKEQANICTTGVEIIIATPGRLYDLISAKIVNVTSVTMLVLDEADRMLDMGFEPQIMKILLDIRPDRQTVMTSATWPDGVRRLATKYLTNAVQLCVGSLDLKAAKTVTQKLEMVKSEDEKSEILMDLIKNRMSESDKLIVFVGRKSTADNLSTELALKGLQCQAIHGDREQCDREEALQDFKDGLVRILIATDVASRGIDVKDITIVMNYDFPRNIEEYVHRVGRTGRAGRTGTSITFMSREDWKHAQELIDILKQGEQEVPESLVDMAERYAAAMKKRAEEGGGGRGGFRGRGGGGGRGGFGGRRGGSGGGGFFF